jgi:hypothetical protein
MSEKINSIDRVYTTWEERERKNREKAKNALPEYMKAFIAQNITHAELEYRGQGDSGESWDWTFYDDERHPLTIDSWKSFKQQKHNYEVLGIDNSGLTEFNEHVESLLSYDWVNNEGGRGIVKFDFKKMEIKIEPYYYEQIEVDASDQIKTEYNFNEST